MLDVAIAPLLWRLDYYGIRTEQNAAPLLQNANASSLPSGLHRGADASEKVVRKMQTMRRRTVNALIYLHRASVLCPGAVRDELPTTYAASRRPCRRVGAGAAEIPSGR